MCEIGSSSLQTNLGTAPVASLGVVLDFSVFHPFLEIQKTSKRVKTTALDGVASTVTDPVWDGSILLLLFSQDQLLAQFLVSRHFSLKIFILYILISLQSNEFLRKTFSIISQETRKG